MILNFSKVDVEATLESPAFIKALFWAIEVPPIQNLLLIKP